MNRNTLAMLVASTLGCAPTGPQDPFLVVSDGQLAPNMALAVDSSGHQHDWVATDNPGRHLDLGYPPGQGWGLVQFWLGLDVSGDRLVEDFSKFNTLQVLLDGTWSAQTLSIGIQAGPAADQLLLTPIQAPLPAHRADQGPTYFQVDLAQFDRPGQPSSRTRLASPASFYFAGGCSALVQVLEISLFQDFVACCGTVCAKDR
jgi:hypothetical protein